MLKVIIAISAIVLSAEVVAISFAPGAEIAMTTPVRALKGDRLNVRPATPVLKLEPARQPLTQVRQVRVA
jgi:hypothetical protein